MGYVLVKMLHNLFVNFLSKLKSVLTGPELPDFGSASILSDPKISLVGQLAKNTRVLDSLIVEELWDGLSAESEFPPYKGNEFTKEDYQKIARVWSELKPGRMYSGCSSKELEERVIQFRSTCYDCWKLSIDEGRDVVKIAREVGKLFVGLNGKARETWIAPELRDMTRTSEVQSPQDLPSLENSLSTTFANTYLFSPDQAKLQAVGTALKSTVFFEGKGCGLVVSKDWHVLTCAHLFEEGKETSSPSVYLLDGDEKIPLGNFEVLEIDKELDMALVQFKPGVHPVPIEFVEAADVNLGFDVIVVGAPGIVTSVMTTHHWEYAVSYGKVSAPRQSRDLVEVEDRSWMPSCSMIEISTYCNGGNSGGPAVNRYGELVGLVFGSDIENCLTWAVPVDVINQFLSKHI